MSSSGGAHTSANHRPLRWESGWPGFRPNRCPGCPGWGAAGRPARRTDRKPMSGYEPADGHQGSQGHPQQAGARPEDPGGEHLPPARTPRSAVVSSAAATPQPKAARTSTADAPDRRTRTGVPAPATTTASVSSVPHTTLVGAGQVSVIAATPQMSGSDHDERWGACQGPGVGGLGPHHRSPTARARQPDRVTRHVGGAGHVGASARTRPGRCPPGQRHRPTQTSQTWTRRSPTTPAPLHGQADRRIPADTSSVRFAALVRAAADTTAVRTPLTVRAGGLQLSRRPIQAESRFHLHRCRDRREHDVLGHRLEQHHLHHHRGHRHRRQHLPSWHAHRPRRPPEPSHLLRRQHGESHRRRQHRHRPPPPPLTKTSSTL